MARVTLRHAWTTGGSPVVTWVWRVPVLFVLLVMLASVAWTYQGIQKCHRNR